MAHNRYPGSIVLDVFSPLKACAITCLYLGKPTWRDLVSFGTLQIWVSSVSNIRIHTKDTQLFLRSKYLIIRSKRFRKDFYYSQLGIYISWKMDLSNWDLDYMIPKGTSHTSVPNFTYEVPKGTMKTRVEPSLPRMSAWKNIKLFIQDLNPEPLQVLQVFRHWTSKPDT